MYARPMVGDVAGEVRTTGEWLVSHRHLATLMGPGATGADAEDMADLLTVKGFPTRLTALEWSAPEWCPVSTEVWDECLTALVAVHAR